MLIGVPKEIKNHEYRVGLTPSGVRELVANGHKVLVQTHAGLAIGFTDEQYIQAGASIASNAEEVFERADMIVKVKEPQPVECRMLRPGQILFTYLHLAPDPEQTKLLIESDSVAIAYETVTDERGGLPLLAPMSEVAGRMAIQAGAHALEKAQGGRGVLLGGVPGVAPAKVVVIGGGVVGLNAARMAMGAGADVTILDKSLSRLKEIDMVFGGRIKTLMSNGANIDDSIRDADLVIGAVLVPGAAAPKLVTRAMLKTMKPGAVLVDVAIDQGGCFETSRPTTHQDPIYTVDGIVHYCVANMPGGVARTSTQALTNATLPYTLELANKGWRQALLDNAHLRNGLNVCRGRVTYQAVARDLGHAYVDPIEAIKAAN
ncbi:alanine dehydrogenase [Chromobacterium violaceum]|uniref:Alanine dehydrogenase n=1 Tax=Chromobacterium violaceum (strain ATCC 12472 / DSM 30191 / JCM 1249 / CCUG 213 / NBRC 12614 / NCIMB 9131 / NCTC 9757 / MK) TaxID=243365 RepID=Q7NWG7_CHRVO|nr:alanine dehydrogenase [Chromobacterium violaceum]AAQ59694.1 alanine dehydrogenase [Chromobacterium violaceum ATCC 12472]ATP28598.1 alanine dehydrogenase [Chromobacterium violaceum]ATP32508.1 alanine dehydrogenase [Chromobacterium violaceum]KJH66225.1 alanine dehydrogenase [Chromobacterium violaceum]KMN49148.1 alanine dehydrogenase [Chromobacterium violaceum]